MQGILQHGERNDAHFFEKLRILRHFLEHLVESAHLVRQLVAHAIVGGRENDKGHDRRAQDLGRVPFEPHDLRRFVYGEVSQLGHIVFIRESIHPHMEDQLAVLVAGHDVVQLLVLIIEDTLICIGQRGLEACEMLGFDIVSVHVHEIEHEMHQHRNVVWQGQSIFDAFLGESASQQDTKKLEDGGRTVAPNLSIVSNQSHLPRRMFLCTLWVSGPQTISKSENSPVFRHLLLVSTVYSSSTTQGYRLANHHGDFASWTPVLVAVFRQRPVARHRSSFDLFRICWIGKKVLELLVLGGR